MIKFFRLDWVVLCDVYYGEVVFRFLIWGFECVGVRFGLGFVRKFVVSC